MILIATQLAKSFVLTRLPECVQPAAVALADRILSRFRKVKLDPTLSGLALPRPLVATQHAHPRGRVRAHAQLPRSKTHEN